MEVIAFGIIALIAIFFIVYVKLRKLYSVD